MSDQNLSCSQISSNSGEQLFGTAPRVDHWFLIEYPKNWEKNAFEKSDIPKNVKDKLNDLLQSFDNSRLQLIRNEFSGDKNITIYYAKSSEFEPKLYKFTLEKFEDILALGLKDLIEKGDINDLESDEKLVLVCTHGAYDSCCGKLGIPVYDKLSKESELTVWRSTHVGSHRFSANLVMLPQGIYYGRVDEKNYKNVLDSHLSDEIYLDCYRGRSCFSQSSQVSEYFLRQQLKKYGFYHIRWEFEKDRDAYIAVEFRVEDEGLVYSVNSIVLNNAIRIRTSCMDEEIKPIHQFYFYSLIPYRPKAKKEDSGQ